MSLYVSPVRRVKCFYYIFLCRNKGKLNFFFYSVQFVQCILWRQLDAYLKKTKLSATFLNFDKFRSYDYNFAVKRSGKLPLETEVNILFSIARCRQALTDNSTVSYGHLETFHGDQIFPPTATVTVTFPSIGMTFFSPFPTLIFSLFERRAKLNLSPLHSRRFHLFFPCFRRWD
jgi:hypothetical protein